MGCSQKAFTIRFQGSNFISYNEFLRSILYSYIYSEQSEGTISALIRSADMYIMNSIRKQYLHPLFNKLEDVPFRDMSSQIKRDIMITDIVSIIYIVYLLLVCTVIWGLLIYKLMNELWEDRMILELIPSEIILNYKLIKEYILSGSKNPTLK